MLLKRGKWCPGAESNHRHCDFQSHALPTELPGHCRLRGTVSTGGPARASHFGDFGQAPAATREWLIKEFGVPVQGSSPPGLRKNSILRILGNLIQIRLFVRRHAIAFGQPLPKVQIGAALGTEGPVVLGGRFAADRTCPPREGRGRIGVSWVFNHDALFSSNGFPGQSVATGRKSRWSARNPTSRKGP